LQKYKTLSAPRGQRGLSPFFPLLLFPALLIAQDQPDPKQLLLHSSDALKNTKSYQIHSLSIVETTGGTNNHTQLPTVISVRRPDRMRLESQNEAAGLTIVSDGSHTFIYFDKDKKYIKRAATQSPESALGESGILRNLPDVNSALQSIAITGEKTMEIDDKPFDCWIVEARYGAIKIPDQQLTITQAIQISWISKTLGLTLQSSFTARLVMGSIPEPVELTQATTTMGLQLDADLPDSLFVFTPPPGSSETPDWTLPGIVKPDVEGKPAPKIPGAIKGKVVLVEFWTPWSAPSKRELLALQKLQTEFRSQGLLVVPLNADKLAPDSEILKSLSISSYPTLVLIDRTGKVVLYEIGAKSEPSLRTALARQGIKPAPAVIK
jgi:outer membrane lipoprotein-sorting protein